MGLFETIRNRTGLMVIVIGGALFAFIMTEFLSSSSVLFSGDRDAIGYINGDKVSYIEFSKRMDHLREGNQQLANSSVAQISQAVWNQELNDRIIGALLDDLGFAVNESELMQAIAENPSIQEMEGFRDPNTGLFQMTLLKNALANLRDNKDQSTEATDQWINWINFENDVHQERLSNKFYAAVGAGLRMPASLFQFNANRNAVQAVVDYAVASVSSIQDSAVEVTEADYRAVYDQRRENFKIDGEMRDVLFASFTIEPNDADRNRVMDELNAMQAELIASEEDSMFVMANSDQPFVDRYIAWDNLPTYLNDAMTSREEGFVAGPIAISKGFELVKVMNAVNLPDSVKAKHVLIAFAGAERSSATRAPVEAQALADSLFNAIKDGSVSFADVNDEFNDDVVARTQGGDLGWFKSGAMANAFENYCFRNASGDVGMVFTPFGFHIVEISKQSGSIPSVRLAHVYRIVDVSKETEQDIYTRAANLAQALQKGDDNYAAAAAAGVALLPNRNMTATDDNMTGLGECRPVVKWAFETGRSLGEVAVVNNAYQQYVVVKLDAIYQDDFKSMDDVRPELELLATNRAKVRLLMEELESQDQPVYNQATVSLASPFIQGAGRESAIIGGMVAQKPGYESGVLQGDNGAYRYKVTNVIENAVNAGIGDVAAENNRLRGNARSFLLQALMSSADIEDLRGKFF
ncbi:MAG: hypothetical protein GWO80_06600 [Bacteroidetes bacterium]|nr:hypothetical protein [Bacteroidota bacterium]